MAGIKDVILGVAAIIVMGTVAVGIVVLAIAFLLTPSRPTIQTIPVGACVEGGGYEPGVRGDPAARDNLICNIPEMQRPFETFAPWEEPPPPGDIFN